MFEPTPLANGLERYFKNLGTPPVDVVTRLGGAWDEIVGPALGAVTAPASIVDGVLEVVCDEPAWSSQISWMETQIKEKFSELFAPSELKKVKPIVRKGRKKDSSENVKKPA